MSNEIRVELPRSRDVTELRVLAERAGTKTLAHDGMQLVRDGITTTDEVLRVTKG
jgi:type II secretory ATPase GspE/PulE/Tfp pilus assembly ATPase PilB-like protein